MKIKLFNLMQLNVAGGIEDCLEYLYKIKKSTGTDEIIITPICNSFEQKYRLSEALAAEFCRTKIIVNDR